MNMQTGNIRLVAHTPDHLRALMEGPKSYELRFGRAVADGVREFLIGPEVSEAFLARLRDAASADMWGDGFGVVQLAEDRLIGVCSFNGPPDAEGAVEIAYGIASTYTGRGYATEAAQLLIAHAFSTGHVRLVRAHTLPEHYASTKVLEKCGFRLCGEVVDEVDGPIWCWELPAPNSTNNPAVDA
jgi:ribosomal-protein-alanine N-acetyltransferase